MIKGGYVYILANKRKGTIYIGITSNLTERIDQHKMGAVDGFTKKYNIKQLVWYEMCDSIEQAIAREKQLKRWNRAWKIELIEKENPAWKDIAETVLT